MVSRSLYLNYWEPSSPNHTFYSFFLSYYIFCVMDAQKLNTKFLSTMKIYILASFIYCLNDSILGIISVANLPVMYDNEKISFFLFPGYEFSFYFVYLRTNFYVIPYTFCGIMDIYIAYTRIQIFRPQYKFLKKTPVA